MKKSLYIFYTVVTLCSSKLAFSQQNKVVSAWKYLSDFYNYKEVEALTKAKDAIDLATEHPDTKVEPKTWLYRGKVYQAMFEQNLKVETDKLKDVTDNNKKAFMAYQATPVSELEQAQQAYVKARELDAKKTYFQEATQKLADCSRHFENKAIALYNAKQFTDALPLFEKCIEVAAVLGITDTANINNTAIVADKINNYEKAKQSYQKLVELKYGKGNTYASLANVQQALKDTAGAIETIKKGRVEFPSDVNLLITETNFFLKQKKSQEAINNLKLAIQKKSDDANLYLVLGNLYDNMANPKDDKGKDLEKPKNYDELFKLAEENYKKAIELNPNYFDALYNIGVLYNNKGVSISKKADTIIDQAKYAAENAKADLEFKKALPFLEKALELSNPKDRNTLIALKQLYARTSQPEKLKQVSDMLKN